MLVETVKDLGLEDSHDLTWIAGQSSIPHDPKKCTVVFLRGQSTYQIVTVSEGDNSTVLAALSGTGETLPPMIIEK